MPYKRQPPPHPKKEHSHEKANLIVRPGIGAPCQRRDDSRSRGVTVSKENWDEKAVCVGVAGMAAGEEMTGGQTINVTEEAILK